MHPSASDRSKFLDQVCQDLNEPITKMDSKFNIGLGLKEFVPTSGSKGDPPQKGMVTLN